MNKQEILKKYKEEEKLLVAKLLDKLEMAHSKNKITHTDFLDLAQKRTVENILLRNEIKQYIQYETFGAYKEAERCMVIFYPEKFDRNIIKKNYNNIMQIVQINLPNELKNSYTHRDYLGALMKLGIRREKIGDILVREDGADVVILKEIIEFVRENLLQLTRFSKSQITIKPIEEIQIVEAKKEEIEIIVPSMRLDNLVAELIKSSRAKANEAIEQERVLVNFEITNKNAKKLQIGDKITIRGKGRYSILEQVGNTKKGNIIIKIEKYI